MGRKSGDLVPFFKEALATSKYINLNLVENANNTCMLYFPRMSPVMSRGCQHILKDWEILRKREYIYSESYSLARQRMQSDIRQSDFLEFISSTRGKIIFQFLEPGEVIEKKLKKKRKSSKIKSNEKEDLNTMDHSPSSSSGYSSGEGSPANCGINKENGHAPLPTPQLDHDYTALGYGALGNPIQKVDQHVENERPPLTNEALIFKNDVDSVCDTESFSVTNKASSSMNNEDPEDVSLDELYKINNFVVTDTEKYEEIMQAYMESINSAENSDEAALLSKFLSDTVNYEVKKLMESTNAVENTREIHCPSNFVPDTVSNEARMHTSQQQLPNNLESTKAVVNTASDIQQVLPSNFDTSEIVPQWEHFSHLSFLDDVDVQLETVSNFKRSAAISEQTSGPGNSSASQVHESTMNLSFEEQELHEEPIPSSAQIFEPRPKKAETTNSVMAKVAAALETKAKMGRKSGDLVPFFKEALATSKYINNLNFVENATNTCMLYFPRMSPTLSRGCQHILKDWENLKKREYIYSASYSSAKQRIKSDIRQSDYLKFISSEGGNIIFQFLEPGEVNEKKLKKKMKRKSPSKIKSKEDDDLNTMDHSPSSSSGYSSGEGSPANCGINKENGHAPLPTPQLDHDYTALGYGALGNPIQNVDQHVENERPPLTNEALIFRNDVDSVCGTESFSVTNKASSSMNNEDPEDVSLDALYKIKDFVVTGTEKHKEIMQEYMESINSAENSDEAALLSKFLSDTVNYEVKMKKLMESTNAVENTTREIHCPSNFVPDTVSYEASMHAPQQQLSNNLESTKAVENTASDIQQVLPSDFGAIMCLDEAATEPLSKLLPNNNSKVCLKCREMIHSMISPTTGCLNLCTGFVHH
ncbi:hypothetical protein JTE90_013412 [Oedothorax gibbosus]|uniref:Uncharacterized protein n=1 Tax=Oedothorax gibbosus TaxID=931172 RepID=A0AAV6TVC5_9ARAC|nr:hypothetical protein JTE90_013412 [Oedothorax gibbosus]